MLLTLPLTHLCQHCSAYTARQHSRAKRSSSDSSSTNPTIISYPNLRCIPSRATLKDEVQSQADSLAVIQQPGLSKGAMLRSLELLLRATMPLTAELLEDRSLLIAALQRQAMAQPQVSGEKCGLGMIGTCCM